MHEYSFDIDYVFAMQGDSILASEVRKWGVLHEDVASLLSWCNSLEKLEKTAPQPHFCDYCDLTSQRCPMEHLRGPPGFKDWELDPYDIAEMRKRGSCYHNTAFKDMNMD